jgi:predicted nucleic acid-binding protein
VQRHAVRRTNLLLLAFRLNCLLTIPAVQGTACFPSASRDRGMTSPGRRVCMLVYLDNVIVCGRIRFDLSAIEMSAVQHIEQASLAGLVKVATSRESWREQDRTRDKTVRSELEQDRPNIQVVADDHRLLGFHHQQDHLGGFVTCPMITDVVDDALLTTFQTAGLKGADARHLMYAVHNRCDRFVTTDPHFLDRRATLERSCRGLRIVRPSELSIELAAIQQLLEGSAADFSRVEEKQ